jgi:hypothetical protein
MENNNENNQQNYQKEIERIREEDYLKEHKNKTRTGSEIIGVIIALLGIVLLFYNIDIIPWSLWPFIIYFWPILLVIVGTRILLGYSWISSFVVVLIILATACAIIIYALVELHSPLVSYLLFNPGSIKIL